MDGKIETLQREKELRQGEKQNDKINSLKSVLPPCNFSANKIENIYKIEDIMINENSIDVTLIQSWAKSQIDETGISLIMLCRILMTR